MQGWVTVTIYWVWPLKNPMPVCFQGQGPRAIDESGLAAVVTQTRSWGRFWPTMTPKNQVLWWPSQGYLRSSLLHGPSNTRSAQWCRSHIRPQPYSQTPGGKCWELGWLPSHTGDCLGPQRVLLTASQVLKTQSFVFSWTQVVFCFNLIPPCRKKCTSWNSVMLAEHFWRSNSGCEHSEALNAVSAVVACRLLFISVKMHS